jgi:gas vesicle protein
VAEGKNKGGFLAGVLVGAVAGMLLAPRRGKEMRDKLFAGRLDLDAQRERLHEAVETGRETAAERSEALKRKIDDTRRRLREQMGAGFEQAGDDEQQG